MKNLTENIWIEIDDVVVLRDLKLCAAQHKLNLPKLPPENGRSICVPFVEYENGFNIKLFFYFAKQHDSGYLYLFGKNFLSKGEFNLKLFIPSDFEISEALASITTQCMSIARRINYPFFIQTVIGEKFIGVVATPHSTIPQEAIEKLN